MSDTTDTVTNRSEIVFLYDAVDANPNGNPLSGSNRPRIDPQTQQAIVTDVRLKRYLRDQLDDDGHGVYIRNVQEEGNQFTRGELLEDRLKAVDYDDYDLDDDEEADQFREDVFGAFLNNSVDVRYFGATMSVDTDKVYAKHLPDHFTGPVQFSPGKSIHAVNENEEYDSLTSVIATQENKQQGGFDLGRLAGAKSVRSHASTAASSTPTRVSISAVSTGISSSIPTTRKPTKSCGRSGT